METVRYVAIAPFRAVWYLLTLPVLAILWLLVLLRRAVWAIVSVPVYYLGRFRDRAAITWDWTKKRGRARLSLPWWGQTCNLKATQSTQTLEEDEDDDQYATPLALPLLSPGQQLDLSSLHQRHPLLNPELFRKLQKVARRRSSSQSQRQAIAALLALYLEQVSPASSPVESEREEGEQRESTASPADPESVPPYHMVRDEKSLRLIMDLMSLSNSSGSGDKHAQAQARRQKAQEIASVYQYDSGKLQELISELDQVSFEMDGRKKARRGKERQSHHSQLRHRHHRSSPPRRTRPQHSPKPRPPSDSDSESPSEACVTAEDRFSDEEPHTSEYHSPPEEFSDSEEEEERKRGRGRGRGKESATASFSQGRRREMGRGREKGKGGSPKGSKPPPRAVVTTAAATASVQEAREESQPFVSERQRASFGGVLSPVQESPEYTRTPSTHHSSGSENELENDLNKALSQLNSETNGLKADAKEVEIIEQAAARISQSSQSSSPSSPFLTSPATPNTVVWEKGTCVVVSSTPDPVQTEKEDRDKKEVEEEEEEEEEGGRGEDEETKDKVTEKAEGERERDREETKAKGEEFPAIPKVAPSLGLKEGHDRQQLAVTRSSTRRRPPTRRTASQDESSSAAAAVGQDPEMERLEKQMQQSVDSLSTLLVEQEGGGKGEREEDERTEEREGEGEGGEDEDSQSEGEESQSEEEDEEEGEAPVKPKKLPGAVRVLPSLSDQMHLLSPGSLQQEHARELSPEALLEESLYSISKPIPIATSTGKRANADAATRPTNISTTSAAGPSSTTSSPGTSWPQRQFIHVQTPQRPRSNSLDAGVHRKTAMQTPTPPPVDRVNKPLMIPSSLPPWIEMRKTPAVPMQPLAPKPPTHTFSPTEQQPAPEVPRTRSSSDPPVMDAIYDVLPKKQEPEPTEPIEQQPEAVEQDSIYDCLQPARDDRIYELPPIKYLHQTISASPATPAKSHRSGREDEEAAREERKKQSSSEKPRSSRDSRESRSHEKERERERGREKERRHRSNPSDREAHSSKHSSSERHSSSKDHSSERKHRSHSREHDKPSSSSSRKHGSSSKSSSDRKESAYSSSKKTSSSSSKEKEAKASKPSSKSKTEKSDSSRSKADSSKSSRSERDRHHRHSERSSRHRDEERGERVLSVLPRSPSRTSIMSTSAIVSSSRTQPHHESLKKTTSLSSLSTSGAGSSARPSPVLDHDSKETLV